MMRNGEPLAWVLKDGIMAYLEKNISSTDADVKMLLLDLTSSPNLSFVSREERDLMRIAIKCRNSYSSKFSQVIVSLLKFHAKKYAWVPYDYGVGEWKLEDFENRIKEMLKDSSLSEKNRHLEKYKKETIARHKKLIKKNNISNLDWKKIVAAQYLSELNDLKKEVFSMSHWFIRPLQEEIAKRLKINWSQFTFMSI